MWQQGRLGLDEVTKGNGAVNAGAGALVSVCTFISDVTDRLLIATSGGRQAPARFCQGRAGLFKAAWVDPRPHKVGLF